MASFLFQSADELASAAAPLVTAESPGQVRVRELSNILSVTAFKWRKLSTLGKGSYGTVYLGVIEGKVCVQYNRAIYCLYSVWHEWILTGRKDQPQTIIIFCLLGKLYCGEGVHSAKRPGGADKSGCEDSD